VTVLSPPPVILRHPVNTTICSNTTARLDVLARPGTAWQWYKDGKLTTEGSGATADIYTTGTLAKSETYKVVVTNGNCPVTATSNEAVVSITDCSDITCTPAESIVDFTAFNPCASAATGTTWYLTDTRESNNVQTYKVRKMLDNHIWMVQDLKFGDKCDNIFTPSMSTDRQGLVTSTNPNHYGDCRINTTPGTGYGYDLPAAINAPGWFIYATAVPACVAGSNCQGVCPIGWRVPSMNDFKAAIPMLSSVVDTSILNEGSIFEGNLTYSSTSGEVADYVSSSGGRSSGNNPNFVFALALGFVPSTGYVNYMWCVAWSTVRVRCMML
jgi:uncharacterized protein (TIGR02145 family)